MPRYKDPSMERCYESALALAADPHSEFYLDGMPRRGAGHRCAFWDGVDGLKRSAHVVPGTMSAAFFQAGKTWAKELAKQKSEEAGATDGPYPEEIIAAREAAGLTQTGAAALVHSKLRTWQQWEAGDREMHPGLWELFQIKTRGMSWN